MEVVCLEVGGVPVVVADSELVQRIHYVGDGGCEHLPRGISLSFCRGKGRHCRNCNSQRENVPVSVDFNFFYTLLEIFAIIEIIDIDQFICK
jgi:hypothetical protein